MSANRPKTDKRRAPRSAFKLGQSGNPNGRPALPADLKEALKANTLPLYERGLEMMELAQRSGDLGTASKLLLGLLKKSLPDAVDVKLSGDESAPIVVREVSDVRHTLLYQLAKLAQGSDEGSPSEGTGEPL